MKEVSHDVRRKQNRYISLKEIKIHEKDVIEKKTLKKTCDVKLGPKVISAGSKM